MVKTTHIRNDYLEAVEVDYGLFAVKLSDCGWSVADGPGTLLSEPDELELAGYHLPVKFKDVESVIKAITTGPDAWFDIETDSEWTVHCLKCGAFAEANYLLSMTQ